MKAVFNFSQVILLQLEGRENVSKCANEMNYSPRWQRFLVGKSSQTFEKFLCRLLWSVQVFADKRAPNSCEPTHISADLLGLTANDGDV
ncbi:MAG: hypothetical protein ABI698_10500 [bacterium]